jgi:hopanoid C-2 methylase
MEAIRTLNRYGLEVTSGIILGLDTDTADSEGHLKAFIDLSQIPVLTINLLQALPRTPLWDRLKRDGRLIEDDADSKATCVSYVHTTMWFRLGTGV